MTLFDFLTDVTHNIPVMIVVGVLLCAVVFQFVTGNWAFSYTKDGKRIFTTRGDRSRYDVANAALKAIQKHIASDDKRQAVLENRFDNLDKNKAEMDRVILSSVKDLNETSKECMAWTQRTILFSENFTVGERISAGSRLEQLSNGWAEDAHCYNGEARSEYERLVSMIDKGEIHRNEYCKNRLRPTAFNYGKGKVERRDIEENRL